jgi:serine/threonine protein kinase
MTPDEIRDGAPRGASDALARIDDALRRLGAEIREGPAANAIRCGEYALARLLSEGAVGEVFLGLRAGVGSGPNEVAIKILRAGIDGGEFLKRFERERAILAKLDHPGIVRVVATGLASDGRPWFAMPFELGAPCTDVANARRLGVADRLAIFASLCDAVGAAHAAGVVHRDLKPSNVLLVERGGALMPSIIDFGIARALDMPHHGLTPEGVAHRLGTPDFMPPEQWKFGIGACDARSDVFALGMLLGALVAGIVPRRAVEAPADGRRRRNPAPGDPCSATEAFDALIARDRDEADRTARLRGARDAADLRAQLASVDRVVLAACSPAEQRPADGAALARLVREACR